MLFSISFYSGLGPDESAVYPLFSALMFLLSTAVVLIGGSLFFRSAWQSLRQGVLHLDLPIAVGIALAYGASVWQAAVHRGQHSYLDTLDVFVTLMLLGRLLEERVLVRNRQLLLEDDGIEGLLVERRAPARPGQTESVPASELCQRDLLLLSPGDLLPVDGICRSPRGAVSCEWITGEPEVRSVAEGEPVAAGSCNRGQAPMWVEAVTGFAASPLPGLLGSATDRDRDRPRHTPSHVRFADRLARGWVVTVLALSALAFALWWGRDPQKAVDVTVALLVVTCPCAIGIAAPLGREAVRARLRRAGLFVRRRDLIERLARVRTILFDKTGTLTLGRLELDDVAPLAALSRTDRDALYTLTAGSSHPRSRSLHRALAALGAQLSLLPVGDLAEEPGLGIGARVGGHTYRVGSPAWALGYSVNGAETALVRDGVPLGFVSHRETLRPDARALLGLLAQRGYRVGLLSGDQPARVHAVAAALGLPAEAAEGGLRPEDKAARVTALDHDDTLYLGDGINDTPAFARAWVAGTPAIERPSVPARADFFLVGEGLSSIALALELCRRLDSILRHNLLLSVTYNTLVVAACLLGWMTPLRAAVAMPTSSLALIALSLVRLERVGGGSSACAPLPSCSTVAAPPLSVRTA
jgi:Cu2+-exporting ATPase